MAVFDLTTKTFDSKIAESEMVIIHFWAPWCAPCKPIRPIFEAAADNYPEILFASINTEAQSELAKTLQVRSIPTLVFIREQMIIFAKTGELTASELAQYINKLKALDMDKVHQDFAEAQTHSNEHN